MAFKLSEEGATSVEYAIMASLVAAVVFAVVVVLGNQVHDLFNSVCLLWH